VVRPPAGLPLDPIPLPGHSPDQLGYFDRETGWLYSGDLVLRRRQQVAMLHEDPWAMINSTNRVLELAPAALATSHRGLLHEPGNVLREQRDYLEDVAGEIARLQQSGMGVNAIVRTLFGGEPKVPGSETTWREATQGEFSARHWVMAFLRPPEANLRTQRG
jgi:glyoxylase-like metal-dependent hydrolase (beta-lactamase superfamily II)